MRSGRLRGPSSQAGGDPRCSRAGGMGSLRNVLASLFPSSSSQAQQTLQLSNAKLFSQQAEMDGGSAAVRVCFAVSDAFVSQMIKTWLRSEAHASHDFLPKQSMLVTSKVP